MARRKRAAPGTALGLELCLLCLATVLLPARGVRKRASMDRDREQRKFLREWRKLREEARPYDEVAKDGPEGASALMQLQDDALGSLNASWLFKNEMGDFPLYSTKKVWGPSPDSFALVPSGLKAMGKKFPIVSFLHGLFGSFSTTYLAYKGLLHYISSFGFVIVVTTLCPAICPMNLYSKIQRTMIRWMKWSFHSGKVDFDRRAFFGHSMGGGSTIISSQVRDSKVKAAVAMNPAPAIGNLHALVLKITAKMPTFFTGGTLDTTMPPPVSWPYYQSSPYGSARVIIRGATHSSAVGVAGSSVGKVVPWTAVFLLCHVSENKDACKRMEDRMCKSLGLLASTCKVKGQWGISSWLPFR